MRLVVIVPFDLVSLSVLCCNKFFTHLPEDPYEICHVMDGICDDLRTVELGLIEKKSLIKSVMC